MDLTLSPEQAEMRRLARELADREIAPTAQARDRSGTFPTDIIRRLADLGFLGAPVPEAYGGLGLDHISQALIAEEIGRADSSVRTTISVQLSLVEKTITKFGREDQKQAWLPRLCRGDIIGCFGLTEPGVGSDATKIATRARRDGDDWVIDGRKMWISNGTVAGLCVLFAQTESALGHRGVTAFLVDRSASPYGAQKISGKLGLRSSDTAELIFDAVRVPDADRLGDIGQGFKIAMAALDAGRFSVAAGAVGTAQACLDASVAYATVRQSFGKPLAAHQLVAEHIAEMAVETEAARLLVWRAAIAKDAGSPATLETSMAKLYASEAASRCADRAIQIHGGYGFSDDFPVERHWRDARVNRLYEGSSEIQKLIIARALTGIDAIA